MNIIRTDDYEQLSRRAALIIAAQVILKPDSVLGLATGSSPEGTYRELAGLYERGEVSFRRVRTVNLDEYAGLSPDHPQSYAFFMREKLFSHIDINMNNTHIPNGLAADGAAECARYDAVIRALGGIDLQLLGLGPNGHIGFNEPAECFETGTHKIALTRETVLANRRFFAREEDVPRQAFTMGVRDIMQAKKIVMVVSGAGKAPVLREALFGPVTPRLPASILQLHPDCTVIFDREAGTLMPD